MASLVCAQLFTCLRREAQDNSTRLKLVGKFSLGVYWTAPVGCRAGQWPSALERGTGTLRR